eukprot:363882-Chlamydomonas_euryale.AAC.6
MHSKGRQRSHANCCVATFLAQQHAALRPQHSSPRNWEIELPRTWTWVNEMQVSAVHYVLA